MHLFSLLFFLLASSFLFGCRPKSKSSIDELEIRARLQEEGRIEIALELPPHSHLYLDKGSRGNLIPIAFDWQALIKKGLLKKEPELLSSPKGEYDKDVEARVLRSKGLYLFSLPQDKDGKQSLRDQNIRVRAQMCDEVEGICYRPEWNEIQISQ